MNAARVVVEILVAGLGACVWCALLVAAILPDTNIPETLKRFGSYAPLATVMILGVAYTLGVLVDRAADYLLSFGLAKAITKRIGERFARRDVTDIECKRLKLFHQEKSVTQFLEYLRSCVRVLRAAVLNVTLIVAPATVLVWKEYGWVSLIVGVLLVIMTFVIYAAAETAFNKFVEEATSLAPPPAECG